MSRSYPKPPITEAVFEVRTSTELTFHELERLRDRFKRSYQAVEEQREVQVRIEANGVGTSSSLNGFKLTASSGSDILVVNKKALATIRLAPYEGWEGLIGAARENLGIFTKVLGRRDITRLAARFINRIDVPIEQSNDLTEYLNIGVSLPSGLTAALGPHSLAAQFTEMDSGASVLVQSGVVDPALIDHISVNLDIDTSFDSGLPNRLEDLWALAEKLRTAKNAVFERLITDKARGLFK